MCVCVSACAFYIRMYAFRFSLSLVRVLSLSLSLSLSAFLSIPLYLSLIVFCSLSLFSHFIHFTQCCVFYLSFLLAFSFVSPMSSFQCCFSPNLSLYLGLSHSQRYNLCRCTYFNTFLLSFSHSVPSLIQNRAGKHVFLD